MRRGGLAAGCFVAYVPQGRRNPEGHAAASARALAMLENIRGMQRDDVRVVDTAAAIEAAFHDGATAIIPAVENGYAMGHDLGLLAQFRALGARYLTLTHNGHNELADSANPRSDLGDRVEEHGGLSALGRAAIEELNRLGMLVDISHVSRAAMLQAAALSRTPVVATHSCMRALCDHPRNLDDAQLDALAAACGVVQVTAVPSFLRRHGRAETITVADFVDHVVHAVRRIGVAHVGISSDFDGGGGFSGWRNASESPNLTAELVARGFGHDEIAALWGGNFLRLLRLAESAAA
jgi:membrane dipeptidase